MADKAIAWISSQKASAPDKPFFAYWAPGAAHADGNCPAGGHAALNVTGQAGGDGYAPDQHMLGMEARLHDYKRDAMLAFIRANRLNKVVTSGGRNPKIGVITTGKSYLDVRQALDELGIDEVKCNEWGLRIDKIACPWPIGRQELIDFAKGRGMKVQANLNLLHYATEEHIERFSREMANAGVDYLFLADGPGAMGPHGAAQFGAALFAGAMGR